MNTRRETTRRVEDKIANAGVPPQDNQAPPQKEVPLGCQDPINLLVMFD